MIQHQDRNFDDIADHFQQKIYGKPKGQIRLAVLERDIFGAIDDLFEQRPLRILDVGAGLAQIAQKLSHLGHEVTINDISQNMLTIAQQNHAKHATPSSNTTLSNHINPKQNSNIIWHICPYQELGDKLVGKYDVILCHALLEWLEKPQAIISFFNQYLTKGGLLSLCFYNPASLIYRNLIMGNFYAVHGFANQTHYGADNNSLTPNNPIKKDDVLAWLKDDYSIYQTSGLRVFCDYVPIKRGGLLDEQAVLEMELKYSREEPFKWLGRYLHVMALKLAG